MFPEYVEIFVFFRHIQPICPSRGHIGPGTHMGLDGGEAVFEELLKTFEECREPNWDGYGVEPYAKRPTV